MMRIAMRGARGPGARLTMDKNAAAASEKGNCLLCNTWEASTLLLLLFCWQAPDDQATQPCGQQLASSLPAAGIYWEIRGHSARWCPYGIWPREISFLSGFSVTTTFYRSHTVSDQFRHSFHPTLQSGVETVPKLIWDCVPSSSSCFTFFILSICLWQRMFEFLKISVRKKRRNCIIGGCINNPLARLCIR